MNNKILLVAFLFLVSITSCYKDESLIQKTIINPKSFFNNTDNWIISKYTENQADSTKVFSKYWVKFNEDSTCAERVIFYKPLHQVWAIWEIYDYADGTSIRFWIPPNTEFQRLEGEWYFNHLTANEIHLFRENQQIIFKR
jgi:hypothetical protein